MEDEVFRLFKQYEDHPYLRLNAISMHIGSGVPSLEPFREAFFKMSDLVQKLRYHGATVTCRSTSAADYGFPIRTSPSLIFRNTGK